LSIADVSSNTVVWERDFDYLNPDVQKDFIPLTTQVGSSFPTHPLSHYKGPAGRELTQRELEDANARLSRTVADYLVAVGFQTVVVGAAATGTTNLEAKAATEISTNFPPPSPGP